MTSPPQKVRVTCPSCGVEYEGYYRPSINLSLGEPWTDEEVEEASSVTCPQCGHRVTVDDAIVVEMAPDGTKVWR